VAIGRRPAEIAWSRCRTDVRRIVQQTGDRIVSFPQVILLVASRRGVRIATALLLASNAVAAGGALAQPTTQSAPAAERSSAVVMDSISVSSFRWLPPRDSYTAWVGGSVATLTASDNENVNGYMRILGVQWARDLFAWHGARFSWVTEALPLMLVNSRAPTRRIPPALRDASRAPDPAALARYQPHDSWGFGIAPLSAQAEITHGERLSSVWQVTSGAAWFSKVVPFGRATQYNFTVNPSVAMQWRATSGTRLSFGYTLHHLSNASFGGSNPGMNSHMFFTRITTERGR